MSVWRLLSMCVLGGMLASCNAAFQRPVDELTIAIQQEPDSLNPALATQAVSNDAVALIYDGLVKFDSQGHIVPDLALAVPSTANGGISQDGRTLTYHLRRQVRWHDGAQFTSSDVRFTWLTLVNKRNNVPSVMGYDKIADVITPDAYTVKVLLKRPYAPALSLFRNTKQGAILPEHLFVHESTFNQSPLNAHPVGTGPYRFERWRRGESLQVSSNAYYWIRPHFKRVTLRFYPDESAATNALLTHNVDAILNVHESQLNRLRETRSVLLASQSTLHWEHLAFNLRAGSGPQADARVRHAIAYALDVPRLNDTIFYQQAQQAPLDQAPTSYARNDRIHYYPRDLRRAHQELKAAGYDRVAISLISTSGSQQRAQLEVQMERMLSDAGIDLTVKNLSPGLFFSRSGAASPLFSGKFQIALFSNESPIPDPDDERYVSADAIPPAGVNFSGYRNREVDRDIALAQSTYDRARRKLLYAHVQQRLIFDLPFYTLAWPRETVAYSTALKNVRPAPIGSDLWNICQWTRS